MSVTYRFKTSFDVPLEPDEFGNARVQNYPAGYVGEIPADHAKAADEAKAGQRVTKTEAAKAEKSE